MEMNHSNDFNGKAHEAAWGGITKQDAAIKYWIKEERGELMDGIMSLVREYMKKAPTETLSLSEEIDIEAVIEEAISDSPIARRQYEHATTYLESWASRWVLNRRAKSPSDLMKTIMGICDPKAADKFLGGAV